MARIVGVDVARQNVGEVRAPLPEVPVDVRHDRTVPQAEREAIHGAAYRHFAAATTLSDAIHAADTFAVTKFERIYINNSSGWRKKPASEGQLAFLNKFRVGEERLRPDDVTKGRAGDMITKIKFGARGRFDKIMLKRRQSEKELAKIEGIENMRKRQIVQVGPLDQ